MPNSINDVLNICNQICNCGNVNFKQENSAYGVYCNDEKVFMYKSGKMYVKKTSPVIQYLKDNFGEKPLDIVSEDNQDFIKINSSMSKRILRGLTKKVVG